MTASSARSARLAAVVLAAGEGKRFRSGLPKVLHDLCGRPLASYAIDAVAAARPDQLIVVTGVGADEVERVVPATTKRRLTFVRQPEQRGTADAARHALRAVKAAHVLIVPGDAPLITAPTIRALVRRHRTSGAAATLLTARVPDPSGYGRIIREDDGDRVVRIVEDRDAGSSERAVDEVNAGMYVFQTAALRTALRAVTTENDQGEEYLPDVIATLVAEGARIESVVAPDAVEVEGVNDRAQLAAAAAEIRARTNERLMTAGVTIIDPAQTYVEPTVRVKAETVIHPGTFLHGSTSIGAGAEIGPHTRIRDSKVADGARVVFSEVTDAVIGEEASVGPYAYLRPGARLAARSKVGSFVEVKDSIIGEGSKVPHLSYIGDATIGKDVNIGAATVTVNYDAETKVKSRTAIGDGAKIGSDTMLVAPVRVGKDAVTGAGSVVTSDVPAGTVVVGAPAKKLRKRKRTKG